MRTPRTVLAASAIAAIAAAAAIPATAAAGTDTSALRAAVTLGGVRAHQAALQAIADANGGTRASGTPGYDASVKYVEDHLIAAGYIVQRQNFDYEFFVVDAPPVIDPTSPDLPAYTPETEIYVMEYSGDGDVTAPVTPVDLVLPPLSLIHI